MTTVCSRKFAFIRLEYDIRQIATKDTQLIIELKKDCPTILSSFVILKLCDTSNNAAIEAGLRTLKGIISTKINYVGGTITISFDPDNVSIEEIESRVRQTEKKRNWLEEIEIRLGELEEKRAMTIARGARI